MYKIKYLKYKEKYLNLKNQYGGIIPNYKSDKKPYHKYNIIMNNRIISKKDNDIFITFNDNFELIDYDVCNLLPNLDIDKYHLFADIEIVINDTHKIPFPLCFLHNKFNILNGIFEKDKIHKDNLLSKLFINYGYLNISSKVNLFNKFTYINKFLELLKILFNSDLEYKSLSSLKASTIGKFTYSKLKDNPKTEPHINYINLCKKILEIFPNDCYYINFNDMMSYYESYLNVNPKTYNEYNTTDTDLDSLDKYLKNDVLDILKYIKSIKEIDDNSESISGIYIKTSLLIISIYIEFRLFKYNLELDGKHEIKNDINQTNFLMNIFNKSYDELNKIIIDNINNDNTKFIKANLKIKLHSDRNIIYNGYEPYMNCFENTFMGFLKLITYNVESKLYDINLIPNAMDEIKDFLPRLNTSEDDNNEKICNDFAKIVLDHINTYKDKEIYFVRKNHELTLNIDKFKNLSKNLLGIDIDNFISKDRSIEIIKSTEIKLEIIDKYKFIIVLEDYNHGYIEIPKNNINVYHPNKHYIYNRLIKYYKNNLPFDEEGILQYEFKLRKFDLLKLLLGKPSININENKFLVNVIEQNNIEILELIISRNDFDVNIIISGRYNTLLLLAITKNYIKVVELLLKKENININSTDYQGCTNLIHACINNYKEIIKLLLLHCNIDVNAKYLIDGKSALMFLCYKNNIELIELILLNENININDKDISGKTALMYAIRNDNIELTELLLSKECININDKDNSGKTALIYAIDYIHNKKLVELLLSKENIDINNKDNSGNSALMYAIADRYNFESIKLLLSKENIDISNKDESGKTLLMNLIKFSDIELIKLVLSKEIININDKDNYGKTALMYATETDKRSFYVYSDEYYIKRQEIVKLLLSNKYINLFEVDLEGNNALLYAINTNNKIDNIKILLEKYPNFINTKNNNQLTPLMIVCERYIFNEEIFKLILDLTIEINKDKNGNTAFYYAIKKNNEFVINEIYKKFPNIINEINNHCHSPLMLSVISSHFSITTFKLIRKLTPVDQFNNKDYNGNTILNLVCDNIREDDPILIKSLLTMNIDINSKNNDGITALMNLCSNLYNNYYLNVRFLLEQKDILINEICNKGQTALMYACKHLNYKIIKLLLNRPDIDVYKKNNLGDTILIILCSKKYLSLKNHYRLPESEKGSFEESEGEFEEEDSYEESGSEEDSYEGSGSEEGSYEESNGEFDEESEGEIEEELDMLYYIIKLFRLSRFEIDSKFFYDIKNNKGKSAFNYLQSNKTINKSVKYKILKLFRK
jgi:ankyrin repeat protein